MNTKSSSQLSSPSKSKLSSKSSSHQYSTQKQLNRVQSEQNLQFDHSPSQRNYQPKYSLRLNQSFTPYQRTKNNPEQLSTINNLKKNDIEFQQLIIQEKQLEYELYVSNNKIQELSRNADSILLPLRILEDQIGIWQEIVRKKSALLEGFCALLANSVTQEIGNIQNQQEMEEQEERYKQITQNNLIFLDNQISSTLNQIQQQTRKNTQIQIQIFNLKQSIPLIIETKINQQKTKKRKRLLLGEEKEKMKIYQKEKIENILILKELEGIQEVLERVKVAPEIHLEVMHDISEEIIKAERIKAEKLLKQRKKEQKQEKQQIPIIKQNIIKMKRNNIILKQKNKKLHNTLYAIKAEDFRRKKQSNK